jgi:hypothetical protein
VALIILGAIVLGGGVAIGVALHGTPTPVAAHGTTSATATAPSSPAGGPPAVGPLPPASGANLTEAAAWIAQQVGTGTVVACDPQACAALTAAGLPAAQQVQLAVDSQSLSGAGIVVVTPALRTLFETNPTLGYYLAPTVLASFGGVTVQPTDSAGAAEYQAALRQDVQDRIKLGEQLLNSGQLIVTPAAQSELAAGDVDPRLLLALQSLADSQPINILGFTDSGPGASPGIPFRAVDLSTADPPDGMSQSAYLQGMVQILKTHATFPAYQKVSRVTLPDGQTAAQVQYAAPSPLGLLGFE